MYCQHGLLGHECPICMPIYSVNTHGAPPPADTLDGVPSWLAGVSYAAEQSTCFVRVRVPPVFAGGPPLQLDLEIEPEQLDHVIELLNRLKERHRQASRLIDVPAS